MVDCVKIYLTSALITMQNLVVVSHTVRAHVGPKNFGDAVAPSHWDGGVAYPKKHAPPTCVSKPYLVALGQTVWAQVREPQKVWGRWGLAPL